MNKSIKSLCKRCGKEISVFPSKIRRNRGLYCSWNCYVKVQENVIEIAHSETKMYIHYKGEVYECLIDENDISLVRKYRSWTLDSHGYVKTNNPYKDGLPRKIYLHRLIAGNKSKMPTDHINRNKLDNRKSNLRITTPSINGKNREFKARRSL